MSEPARPLLPANRAFVIQLGAGTAESEICHGGRVEHLSSGQAAHFASEDELWAFVDGVLSVVDSSGVEDAASPRAGRGRAARPPT